MNPFTNSAQRPVGSRLAIIYRRVSTDKQDDSLELQERRTLDYALLKGFEVPETLVFSDPDTSGGIPIIERAGGRLMMYRLQAGDVGHVIIAKLDRLGRNVRDCLGVLEFCKKHEVALHIVDLGGETISTQGHIGRMILTMPLAVAEWELEEIRDRTRKQMQSLFDQHKLTGNVPYGWDCNYEFADGTVLTRSRSIPATELAGLEQQHGRCAKRLVDNLAEQWVIIWMAGAVRTGKREHIARQLNRRGLRTKLGRSWQIGHVTSVLNSRYTRRLLEQTTIDTKPTYNHGFFLKKLDSKQKLIFA
jgi:DNA invertase Pin-like site-specific DNA recombinase